MKSLSKMAGELNRRANSMDLRDRDRMREKFTRVAARYLRREGLDPRAFKVEVSLSSGPYASVEIKHNSAVDRLAMIVEIK